MLSEYTGAKYVHCVPSATMGLLIASMLADIKHNEPFSASAYTQAATVNGATSNVAGANIRLVANAFSEPRGAAISYKWLQKNVIAGGAFIDVAATQGGAGVSGQTSNILFVANVKHVDAQVFICHATTTNEFGVIGAANSNPVTVELSS